MRAGSTGDDQRVHPFNANLGAANIAGPSAGTPTGASVGTVGSTARGGANSRFEGRVRGGTSFSAAAGTTITRGRIRTGTGQTITLAGKSINLDGPPSGDSGGLALRGAGV